MAVPLAVGVPLGAGLRVGVTETDGLGDGDAGVADGDAVVGELEGLAGGLLRDELDGLAVAAGVLL